MKAIHNWLCEEMWLVQVVLYPKDTEKWKQFTTVIDFILEYKELFCIPKILKNESNSQQFQSAIGVNFGCFVSQRYWKMKAIHNFNAVGVKPFESCFVSQRYWKMKAIHNTLYGNIACHCVVLYPKDTEKWKQFTTEIDADITKGMLFCIPKILKNESNSQLICKRM